MKDQAMLEKLKADRQLCLLRLRRYAPVIAVLSVAAFALHFAFGIPPLLNTCALVACLWLAVSNFGIAYLILGVHIRRMRCD